MKRFFLVFSLLAGIVSINTQSQLNAQENYTSSITNPSFENNLNGWTNTGMQRQNNREAAAGKTGTYYCESWVATPGTLANISIRQTITNLPNGTYRVSATCHAEYQADAAREITGAYLFAGDEKTAVNKTTAVYTVEALCFDGELTIGFMTETTNANWATVDNFQLTYLGVDLTSLKAALSSAIDNLQELASTKKILPQTLRNQVTELVRTSQQLLTNASATEDQYTQAINDVNDLYNTCKAYRLTVERNDPYERYLFTYFPNNDDENLYYAISEDGFEYTPLNNGQKVMASDTVAIKKGIRDPHVLRGEDGAFYMVATDMRCAEGWDSNRGLVMYKSTDMIHWQHSTVHFPTRFPDKWRNVTHVWAPETIWDADYENTDGTKGRYMIYFSLLTNDGTCTYDKLFYCYANDDFTDLLTEPVYLYDCGSSTIDADIVFDERDQLYHMIFKGMGGIASITAEHLTAAPGEELGSQWSAPITNLQQTNVAVEGGGLFRLINENTWVLMYDCYTSGYYQFCTTEDWENFQHRAYTTMQGAFTPRHGTVLPITAEEYNALLAAFPTSGLRPIGEEIAPPSPGDDITYYIVNPSFENALNGWTNTGMQAQNNNEATAGKTGTYYCESWVKTPGTLANISLNQTITDLPDGVYRVSATCHAAYQADAAREITGAYLFAGDEKVAVGKTTAVYTVEALCTGGELTIGFMTESTNANWVTVDNFQMIYLGASLSASKNALSSAIDDLQELSSTKKILPQTLLDEVAELVRTSQLLLASATATEDDYTQATQNVRVLYNTCKEFRLTVERNDPYERYLFAYFPNNNDENLYYAISEDGFDYIPLNNGQRVMASDTVAIKKGIRDPHILRGEDGAFYMVATDMRSAEGWSSNRGIVMYRSTDMIHWQHSTVHFPTRFPDKWSNVTRVWAPETIWDANYENTDGTKGRYLIYFSLLTNDGTCTYDKVFYCYANDDFTDLMTEPVFFYDRGSATIDADIVFDERDQLYHMIFKNEGSGGIASVTAERLTVAPGEEPGSQWSTPSANLQQTNVAVEGGGLFRLIDTNTWVLMYDCYGSGYYQFCTTEDWVNFQHQKNTTTQGAFTPRHGTVLPITAEEYNALLAAFPTAGLRPIKGEGEEEDLPSPGDDMTSYIINPTVNGQTGWTCEKTVNGNGPMLGTEKFEYWSYTQGAGGFDYYQTIKGLPNGLYVLSATMMNDQAANAAAFTPAAGVYATSTWGTVYGLVTDYANGAGQGALKEYSTTEIIVTDGVLRVGVKNESATMPARWFVADDFRLTYVGPLDNTTTVAAYNDALSAAQEAQGKPMTSAASTALDAAVAKWDGHTFSNADEYLTAAEELSEAVSTAKTSIDAYASAKEAIDKANAIMAETNVYTAAAYNTYRSATDALQQKYENGTLTNNEALNADTNLNGGTEYKHNGDPMRPFYSSAWTATNGADVYTNNWSVEGNADGSDYFTPFLEYWVANGRNLGNTEISATLTGLEPGTYKVTAWVRVLNTNRTGFNGISMSGNDTSKNFTGTDRAGDFALEEMELTATVQDNGQLKIAFNVNGTNCSWLSIKGVKYEQVVPFPDVNEDGNITIADLSLLIRKLLSGSKVYNEGQISELLNLLLQK